MTAAALDLRGTPDEELLSLYRSDERAAAAALAEAARRDRTDRAAASRAALRAEWYDAAYQQFLMAEAVTPGQPALTRGPGRRYRGPVQPVARPRGRRHEVRERGAAGLWAVSPRITITEYARRWRHPAAWHAKT